ncbi:hypothetical protein VSH64_00740 [Amycolatopsis rhabdoformis]|uniref:NACHT domain-containing protein n=1 Tax=Amycolatopsis rhabdoformis TaxID=1448059 RepID=A0ABZ1I8G6_9PSEU|nr:hypothetical protein [Amycolatopsis rhabdoformis]WSE30672.1 hypothetical protein VSH64_00740 [Amycolatopsis rhabdoformis]
MTGEQPEGSFTNQVLGPVHGTVVQVGHANTVVASPPPVRSRYLEWVRQVAPAQLVGRSAELAELAAFCVAPDSAPYAWWRAAPWAGKSALMASFVLAPPPGVRVVSFFITARSGGDDTREAFVDVVQEQLAEVLGAAKDPAARNLNAVFSDAAALCQSRGERLVLVVDGLDEDRVSGGHSIAALLPLPAPGLRVIVASRLNPDLPSDVRADHPLRASGIERLLTPSPAAGAARDDMERELDALLDGASGEKDLLGFLVAARGGLSSADLAELTGRRPREVERALATRSFTRRPAHWNSRIAPQVYLLAHENLQLEAVDALGPSMLEGCWRAIKEWATGYRAAGWPADTPQFLLRGYFRLVDETGDVLALTDLAADPARHDRLLDVSNGDLAAMVELDAARTALLDSSEPDLLRLITVETYRDTFRGRNKLTPRRLPAIWAELGRIDHAVALAQSITEPGLRAAALVDLVGALARIDQVGRARLVAEEEYDPQLRDSLLGEILLTLMSSGQADEAAVGLDDRLSADQRKRVHSVIAFNHGEFATAARLGGEISDEGLRDRTLERLGEALAIDHPGMAEDLAAVIANEFRRNSVLAEVARSLFRRGDLARARQLAQKCGRSPLMQLELAESDDFVEAAVGLDEETRQRDFLPALVAVLAEAGRWSEIPAVLDSMTNKFRRSDATIHFLRALTAAGDTDLAFEWLRRIPPNGLVEGHFDVRGYVNVADTLLAGGNLDRAREAAEQAEKLVRRPAGDQRTFEALGALTRTVVAAGDVLRAELLARLVMPDWRAPRGIQELAAFLAAEGDPGTAEKLICGHELWWTMRDPLVTLARRLRESGDHAALARLAKYIRNRVKRLGEDQPYSWDAAIVMLCAVGEPSEITELVAAYSAENPGLILAVTDATAVLGARGEVAVALELCELIPKSASQLKEKLVSGLAKAGYLDEAEEVVESSTEPFERDRLVKAFVPELAQHDLGRALVQARLARFVSDRARLLVEISAAAPPNGRRQILAEAASVHHWSVIVPALDAEELGGLLGVVDRFGALYDSADPDADPDEDPDNPDV